MEESSANTKTLSRPAEPADKGASNNTVAPSASSDAGSKPVGKKPNTAGIIVFIVVLAAASVYGYRAYVFGQNHITTDDAYITSHVVQITPQVSGSVNKIYVNDNDHVKQGQLLAQIDDSTYLAAVAQAQADLAQAEAAAKGAGEGVGLTQASGSAEIAQAQGGVSQAQSAVAAASADALRAQSGIALAGSAVQSALAGVQGAKAQLAQSQAALQKAKQNVLFHQAALQTSVAQAAAARSAAAAAQADAANAAENDKRYRILLQEDAIAAQQYDAIHTRAVAAASNLQSARQGVQAALAVVVQQQADLAAARAAVKADQAGVTRAAAALAASRSQVNSADSAKKQARAEYLAAEQNVNAARGMDAQARGKLQQALTAPRQVLVQQANAATAKARILQAEAALHTAEINLQRTRIYAPVAGHVSAKSVQLGEQVAVGQPLMAVIPDNDLWVVGNFKETKLAHLHPGESAEIEVDTFSNHTFAGHVDSISPGTGATFALLPPDNATGNFTKVVQRVPVKVVFDPKQADLDKLRAGLSATLIIKTR